MFTGLVQALGSVRRLERHGRGDKLVVEAELGSLSLGESIAVDGVCLTATRFDAQSFEAEASAETLEKTGLGRYGAGTRVHLERALRLSDRLGGHLVTGHVDALATVVSRQPVGDCVKLCYEVPEALARYLAPKGSVAVDGTSLTVNGVEGCRFDVMLVPHTLTATHLGERRAGQQVNIEVDILARYVARLLAGGTDGEGRGLSLDQLARQGYV